ncbi:MAG: glucose-6-phosphate isomerase [Thaumarchaeota archaeon]|nr:MAG: glucose-6-phosphate isomerase [Nitrososphaerota archaeon]
MNIEDLKKIDSKKMYQTYDKWPEIAKDSFDNDFEKFDTKGIDHIVFSGMGGSGSIGDVVSAILSKEDIHVSNVKGYHLPKTVDSNSLVVATSISGNTKETLTVLEKAQKTDAKIAVFSSGGMLQKFSETNNLFFQEISMIHSPRASFPKFLFSILNILKEIIPIKEIDVKEAISSLEITRNSIFSNNLTEENISLKLAEWIKEIPLIYYPWGLQSAAIRFKNSLQENSKTHVITEDVIESCHNDIVAWEKNSNVQPILIRGHDDYIKTIERWDILKEFFRDRKIEFFEIKSVDGNILSKIVNLVYLLDYASIYHAVLKKIDPSPVNAIDFVKARL